MPVNPLEGNALAQTLSALLELGRRAREARSEAELGFLLVNDTLMLTPFRQAALSGPGGTISKLSGLVEPDANAPYAQWVCAVFKHADAVASAGARDPKAPSGPRQILAHDLTGDAARDWVEWWPAHAAWIPIPSGGALLLAREEPWSDTDLQVLQEWCTIWSHARQTLRLRHGRRWWPWRRETLGVDEHSVRPWWRRKLTWALALLLLSGIVPVPLSVLAPGELVPAHPLVVRAPVEGVVDAFHVQPNEVVRKGQALFGFDEALIQSKLEVAQQSLATTATELRQTTQQALVDPRARSQLSVLSGRIQERRAEVNYLREQLGRSRVLSPVDGVVLFDDPAEWIGKPVSVGERILRVAAIDDVEVEAWVPLSDAIRLPAGAAVTLYLNAAPLEPVSARLRYMAHDAVQRPDGAYAYRVRATLDSRTGARVGLKGTARLQGESVPLAYWVMRRPIAVVRTTLGI